MNKKETIAAIKANIETSQKAALKAMLRVYAEQTTSEKAWGVTSDLNGRGFSKVDGHVITNIAKEYARTGVITETGLVQIKRRMPKYAEQLFLLALESGRLVRKSHFNYEWAEKK